MDQNSGEKGRFSKMLREREPTERTLMMGLKLAYRSIQAREKYPEKFTIEDLFRVAALLNKPLEDVITALVEEVKESGRMPTVRSRTDSQPQKA